jgi:thioesterase domain-containing protein
MVAMAAHYLEAIRTVQPEGPYYLGGYCLGAVIAFEMACQLEAAGQEVGLLALLEGYAPPRARDQKPPWHPRVLLSVARHFPYWLADYSTQGIGGLFGRLRVRLRRVVNQMAPDRDIETARFVLEDVLVDASQIPEARRRVMQANLDAMRSYEPGLYHGDLTLFRVRAPLLFLAHEPYFGWEKLTTGQIHIKQIPGAHHHICKQPHVQVLAAKLKESLVEAQASAQKRPQSVVDSFFQE